MKLPSPRLWIAFFSLSGVIAIGLLEIGRRSAPGPITAVHGRVPELVGRNGCAQCHGGWTQTMAEACLDCHGVIEVQLADGMGFHGVLGSEQGLRCALCHSEHHGMTRSTSRRPWSSPAGRTARLS